MSLTAHAYGHNERGPTWTREDDATGETVAIFAPLKWVDDFLGDDKSLLEANSPWRTTTSDFSSSAQVTDEIGGVRSFTLGVTSDAAQERIDWGDVLQVSPAKEPCVEFRINMKAAPIASAEIALGLSNASATTAEGHTHQASFVLKASAVIQCTSDDATTAVAATTSGQTAVADTWRICRIDCSNTADVKFYIDGTRVCSDTTFAVLSTQNLQPYVHVAKSTGASVACLELDYVKLWGRR